MNLGRIKRAFVLILCFFVMGIPANAKASSTTKCYNHDCNKVIVVAPTCGNNGWRLYYCSKCGYRVKSEYLKPTENHFYGSWITVRAATCTQKGARKHICSKCGTEEREETNPLGHSFTGRYKTVEPTCTKAGYIAAVCSRCGTLGSKVAIAAKGHSWGVWVTDKTPTISSSGLQHRTCSACRAIEQRTIPKLGK